MNELPGATAVGIESVEWFRMDASTLTVRVTGRWRRHQPALSGETVLVLESDGRRHRFAAEPDAQNPSGNGAGIWQLNFRVPESLVTELDGRTWLQFGTVVVPLPRAVPVPAPVGTEVRPGPPELSLVTERDPPFDEPQLTGMAVEVSALQHELLDTRRRREELAERLADRDRRRRLAEQRAHAEEAMRRDLARRLAATEREAKRAREALGELASAEDRIRDLESELRVARRRVDEAEQTAAAARARRSNRAEATAPVQASAAPAPAAAPPAPMPPVESATPSETAMPSEISGASESSESSEAEVSRLRLERELSARRASSAPRIATEPARTPAPTVAGPEPGADAPALGEAQLEAPQLVDALRHQLDARVAAEATLRARLVDAEARLATRVLLERRTTAILAELREELDSLGEALSHARGLQEAAERRAAELQGRLAGQIDVAREAYDAIGELRGAIHDLGLIGDPESQVEVEGEPGVTQSRSEVEISLRRATSAAASIAEPEPAAAPVRAPLLEPTRLDDARSRLRETTEPPAAPDSLASAEPEAAEPDAALRASLRDALGRPSVQRTFRELARIDADAAGRLLLELLSLPRVVYPAPVAYDLVFGPGRGIGWASVPGGIPTIKVQSAPRPPSEVDFQVFGEPAKIARMLAAGRLRRRVDPRVARVRGKREKFSALTAVLGTPLDIDALIAAGTRLDAVATLRFIACAIDPVAPAGMRFTLVHRSPEGATAYMLVGDERPFEVTTVAATGGGATIVISCAEHDLLAVLAGGKVSPLAIQDDGQALATLREWIKRAQSE